MEYLLSNWVAENNIAIKTKSDDWGHVSNWLYDFWKQKGQGLNDLQYHWNCLYLENYYNFQVPHFGTKLFNTTAQIWCVPWFLFDSYWCMMGHQGFLPTSQQIAGRSPRAVAPPGRNIVSGWSERSCQILQWWLPSKLPEYLGRLQAYL